MASATKAARINTADERILAAGGSQGFRDQRKLCWQIVDDDTQSKSMERGECEGEGKKRKRSETKGKREKKRRSTKKQSRRTWLTTKEGTKKKRPESRAAAETIN